eukprot:2777570-Prymnesium_polylepis.1
MCIRDRLTRQDPESRGCAIRSCARRQRLRRSNTRHGGVAEDSRARQPSARRRGGLSSCMIHPHNRFHPHGRSMPSRLAYRVLLIRHAPLPNMARAPP